MFAALANLNVTRAICEANLADAQKQLNEMKTETWIKVSDRKPTVHDANSEGNVWFWNPCHDWPQDDAWDCGAGATHWMPKPWIAPKPPVMEPTRDEQDREAFIKEFGDDPGFPSSPHDFREKQWHQHRRGWIAALEYEREQLESVFALYTANDISIQELVKRVKERVG